MEISRTLFQGTIPIILLMSLCGTQFALSDPQIYSKKGDLTTMALDLCTPYAMHVGMNITTQDFNNGYVVGFCKSEPGGGSDADQAAFSCN